MGTQTKSFSSGYTGARARKARDFIFCGYGNGNGNLYRFLSLGKIVILFLIVITRHLDPAKTLHDFARNTFSMRIYNTYVWICLCEMIWHVWGNSNSISIFWEATLLCLFVDLKKPMIFFFFDGKEANGLAYQTKKKKKKKEGNGLGWKLKF